uniref:Adhesion G protein-coupled receptor G3 n=1 Tax=Oryzias latipes TaxID=8090 RepID=A0A3P9MEZ9_ORYLA
MKVYITVVLTIFLFCISSRGTKNIETLLESISVNKTTTISGENYVVMLYKHTNPFNGAVFYANETQADSDKPVYNPTITVQLPGELNLSKMEDMIVFINLKLSDWNDSFPRLYENRLVGLSVKNRRITGLKTPVNITMSYSAGLNKTQEPQCVFLNNTSQAFSTEGCQTQWEYGQHQVICSCDHLTYFGILMVSASLSSTDQQILSRITEIGCGISLFCLVVTVFVFYTRRKIKVDDSKKIHISLAIALILLNLHFLTSEMVAESSSSGLCVYMALALHYSLLATFCWMGLEGFHLYLLIIKVFNIYINRYMLKISVVGWGVPAVIVLLLLSINTKFYGKYTFVDSSNSTSSTICYITDENVKWVTTVGVFGLMFLFVMVVFLLTVRNLMPNCCQKEFRQKNWKGLKQNVCTVLVLITLLGITWGIIFFSFGQLTTPGLYVFCILNSLQGFFIFLYFVFSLRKTKDIPASSSERPTTTSLDILE